MKLYALCTLHEVKPDPGYTFTPRAKRNKNRPAGERAPVSAMLQRPPLLLLKQTLRVCKKKPLSTTTTHTVTLIIPTNRTSHKHTRTNPKIHLSGMNYLRLGTMWRA
jgi:hypothetical protein